MAFNFIWIYMTDFFVQFVMPSFTHFLQAMSFAFCHKSKPYCSNKKQSCLSVFFEHKIIVVFFSIIEGLRFLKLYLKMCRYHEQLIQALLPALSRVSRKHWSKVMMSRQTQERTDKKSHWHYCFEEGILNCLHPHVIHHHASIRCFYTFMIVLQNTTTFDYFIVLHLQRVVQVRLQ